LETEYDSLGLDLQSQFSASGDPLFLYPFFFVAAISIFN